MPAASLRLVTASSTAFALNQIARLDLRELEHLRIGEVAKRAVGFDRAEFVARPFLDHVGDDEVAAVRRQLGERRHDAEIRIALCQVEGAKLLLVGRETIRIVGVVRLQEAEHAAGLARVHLLAQPPVGKCVVAEDVDRADLGEVAFIDFEHDVDAVLVELDDLRIDPRGESALPAIEFEDPVDVRARPRERVKICRGASLISGVILSSLRRLLPSRMMRLMTGFSRTLMTRSPVSAPLIVTSANSCVA